MAMSMHRIFTLDTTEAGIARTPALMPMWGPTDQMVSMMYGGSALELYDCRAAHK